jgi:hypothetical protein
MNTYSKSAVETPASSTPTESAPIRTQEPLRLRLPLTILITSVLMAQTPATQPGSRFESISLLQAEKAKAVHPPERDKVEDWVKKAEMLFLLDPSGVFP